MAQRVGDLSTQKNMARTLKEELLMIDRNKWTTLTISILMIFFVTTASASDARGSLPSKESVEAGAEAVGIFSVMFRTAGQG